LHKDYGFASIVNMNIFDQANRTPSEILHLDTKVTEDFINGKASSNGATHSTGTRLLLNDLLIAYRGSDGQVYAVRKGMNTEAEAMLKNLGLIKK
jgi:hypothetical protein